ncbi:MAG TPA: hypothetical protein VNL14_13910 [Candidatus Acidoferrales bacterium]|nr:hypothetical protein [Candidatus Acidoferrales bacterium]
MTIISFAHTTPQLLERSKTVTRRDWTDKHAQKFRAGEVVQAYDKSPRCGGKRVCFIRIKEIRLEALEALRNPIYGPAEMIKEGFPGRDPLEFEKTFFSHSRRQDGTVYRIEFEIVDEPGRDWLKAERLRINLCCNNPDNGMFDGKAFAIEFGDNLSLTSQFRGWSPRLTRGPGRSWLRIGGSPRCPVLSYKEWFGNWCWDSIVTDSRSAMRVLNWIKEGKWRRRRS